MAEDDSKQDLFNAAGQTPGYISLDEARVLAVEHARDNRGFYGRRYRGRELVWEVVNQEEQEDHYDVKLSFRPAGRFRGHSGIEHFIIEKTGQIRVRQLVDLPSGKRASLLLLSSFGAIVALAIASGVEFALGVFDPNGEPPPQAGDVEKTPQSTAPPTEVSLASATSTLTPSASFTPTLTPTPTRTLTPGPTPRPSPIVHPYGEPIFGVSVQEVDPSLIRQQDLVVTHGLLVEKVTPGTTASVIGVRPRDITNYIDNDPIRTRDDLITVLARLGIGTRATVTLQRGLV